MPIDDCASVDASESSLTPSLTWILINPHTTVQLDFRTSLNSALPSNRGTGSASVPCAKIIKGRAGISTTKVRRSNVSQALGRANSDRSSPVTPGLAAFTSRAFDLVPGATGLRSTEPISLAEQWNRPGRNLG